MGLTPAESDPPGPATLFVEFARVSTEQQLTLKMRGEAGQSALTTALGRSKDSGYMAALAELVTDLLGSAERETVMAALEKTDKAMVGHQTICVIAWPPRGEQLRYLIPPIKGQKAAVSASLCRRAAELKEGLLFSDDQAREDDYGQSAILKGIRSAVYTPLFGPEERVLGILCVDRTTPGLPIDEETFQFIRAVGGLLSTSLSAELLRKKAQKKELETREAEARREGLVRFLSIASHDLKNPLTVVLGCARLLPHVKEQGQIQILGDKIVNAGERAQALIKAYLDVSELASGAHLKLNLEPVDLGKLIDEEIEFLEDSPVFTDKITFVNEVTGIQVQADRQKLQQVLSNLISNAAKYSPDGGEVKIWIEREDGLLRLKIRDQGVGISPEDQKKLFQQFQRVGDPSLAEGTGLGLWLTGGLVRSHGGQITVESQVGQGSTFIVTLPDSHDVN